MLKKKLDFKSSVINYYIYGDGGKALFCLHGYGDDSTSFSFLEKYVGSNYTLYAIDLPFHGETNWEKSKSMSAEDLLAICNSININNGQKISILAYSFGGRIAMYLLQKFPDKIERIILIAPDGLHVNFWHWFSTQTILGNKLFKRSMHNPKYFFFFLNMANRTNMINKSIVKFIHNFLDDEKERTLLYKRWNATQKFMPDLSLIKKLSAKNNIGIQFLFGNFDRIILSKRASCFKNVKNVRITTIDAGHRLLNETYASHIVTLLKSRI